MKDNDMLDNKGFTLVEVVVCLVIISFVSVLIVSVSGYTFSVNKEKAYELMKDNIYKASLNYLNECESNQLKCNVGWQGDETSFYVENLKASGYFEDLLSPIDGKDLSKCLIIRAFKQNGTINVEIVDNCY